MPISRREFFLALVSALLGLALTEIVSRFKDGTVSNIIFNFSDTSASLKFFILTAILLIGMVFAWIAGYVLIFSLNNIVRLSTASLGISFTVHGAVSGLTFGFIESIIFACIVILISLYSLFEVYLTLRFAPKDTPGHQKPNLGSRVDAETLRSFLDASKVSYENLTYELRKRGVLFKKRDLTPIQKFESAARVLEDSGVRTIRELDEILASASAHADKIQFMLSQDKNGLVLQPELIETIAEMRKKGLL